MITDICDAIDAIVNCETGEHSTNSADAAKEIIWDIAMCRDTVSSWFSGQNVRPSDDQILKSLKGMFECIEAKIIRQVNFAESSEYVLAHHVYSKTDDIRAALKQAARHEIHPLHDQKVRDAVWELTGGKCAYCDCDLKACKTSEANEAFCIEHVVPKSSGGPDNISNYVPACHSCNASKKSDHVLSFIRRRFNGRLRLVEGGEAA